MGTLTNDSFELTRQYGHLAIRFNNLRLLYKCSAAQLEKHLAPDVCLLGLPK